MTPISRTLSVMAYKARSRRKRPMESQQRQQLLILRFLRLSFLQRLKISLNISLRNFAIHACTVSFRKTSAIYIWHSVMVYPAKPLHCNFTVQWFSGALKSSCRYFSSKTTCSFERREITTRSLQYTNPTGLSPTVKREKFA